MDKNLKENRTIQPKISVLVPIYNVAPFIEKCAHSLFNQTFKDVEYIFVNDCTPDNSLELLESVLNGYPTVRAQVRIISHAENKGIGETRNTLIKAATGEHIMWVDSDDYLAEDALELLYNKTITSSADIVTTDSYYICQKDEKISLVSQNFPTNNKEYIYALAFRQTRAALWGTLSKLSLWTENNILMAQGINFGEDYYATVRLFYFSRKIVVVNQPVYFYNQSNLSSYSSGKKQELHFQSIIQLFDLLAEFFTQQNDYDSYKQFVETAKLVDRNSFILHTTASLRRKYATLYIEEIKRGNTVSLSFSRWQRFILHLINHKLFALADFTIIFAKLLRLIFKINF